MRVITVHSGEVKGLKNPEILKGNVRFQEMNLDLRSSPVVGGEINRIVIDQIVV